MVEDTEQNAMEKQNPEDKVPEGNADEENNGDKNNSNTESSPDESAPESPSNKDESSPAKDNSKDDLKEGSGDTETDVNGDPKSEENETEPMEDDDHPNGPTLQVSVAPGDDGDADGDNDGDDVDDQAGPTLQFTFQQNTEDIQDEIENEKPETSGSRKRPRTETKEPEKGEEFHLLNTHVEYEDKDPQTIADKKTVSDNKPETDLELALSRLLTGKENHVAKLTNEIKKLKGFISKRKQTYKRKRKDEGAPTRALSAYNIFVQDQFAKLAKKNSAALQSTDTNAQLERVPPANLVASTGGQWKNLPEEEKQKYRERAKSDRKRYDEQMAKYQPPDKAGNRKRNKTGYNMFFSAHVLRLKQSELGVPSERGSVARLVGTAWKQLSTEEKQYYEREADKHNGMNPVDKTDDDDKERDENKETSQAQQQSAQQQAAQQQAAQAQQQAAAAAAQDPYAAHAAAAAAAQYPHDISAATGYAHAMHQVAAQQHDPRVAAAHHGYYYPHPQTAHAYHYDYGGHHAPPQPPQQPPGQQGHQRSSRGQYQYGQQTHGYYDK
eukprot:CAMPEP_0116124350 /NCGR_PEP_ID=MMETSP0329-20121206/5234_1 /TAXON_ID=697910 /ORGANISM="Pseudo-nitzschia arenysensis, Strain B593" /LENGTH=552 /DNA_ID=CAMNT_0003618325 /DNA_START=172 /DNA_END=1830 /DNA_ORIENTATION=+